MPGGIDLHAGNNSSFPVVAHLKCGDPVVLIDERTGPHIRTTDGKEGFITMQNFGQFAIEEQASAMNSNEVKPAAPIARAPEAAAPPAPVKQAEPETAAKQEPVPTPKQTASAPNETTPAPKQTAPTLKPAPAAPASEPAPAKQTTAGKKKEIKIHGYVTALNSLTSFDIEDYRITRDDSFKLEFENTSPDLSFKIEDVKVGTELEIKGSYDAASSELHASSIKVGMEQFKKLKDTAILDRAPTGVEHVDSGWRGMFFVNGQRIQVTPSTAVVFKLTNQEKKIAKNAKKQLEAADDASFRPLSSLSEITSGMMMTYEGKRDIETGQIFADRVEFSKNEFEKGEERLWKQLKVKVKPSNAQTFKPGELTIARVGKYKLLPNEDVQSYVTKLGEGLIPDYIKAMPDSDPAKLHFNFYVVINKEPNASALPNGTFLVHSGMFDVVENEAQLAAVIGHEIAHATQEHTWRQMNYHKNIKFALGIASAVAAAYGQNNLARLANMTEAAIQNGYQRNLENQADRIGLEYMVRAGYDPREAPRLWKQMTKAYGLQATDFFWSTHDNQATRRSYLMNEIKNNYADVNYAQLRSDGDKFAAIKTAVKQGATTKRTIKVKAD
jgi:hypothetical protein